MVWKYFYQELLQKNLRLNLSEAFLMTGGGWKKLTSEAVTRKIFKQKLSELCGIKHFLDHYSMVEQTGCLYAECECGNLHASIYSDVFVISVSKELFSLFLRCLNLIPVILC